MTTHNKKPKSVFEKRWKVFIDTITGTVSIFYGRKWCPYEEIATNLFEDLARHIVKLHNASLKKPRE